ncbi:hypothetical protein [Helicobacter pylori]|uniref:hypothetical protein n=1 Tax=Helicobacter pylori TaxID=210 RepID=UPI0003F60FA1|nr:hypothetical protein [Helicobacter pylori]
MTLKIEATCLVGGLCCSQILSCKERLKFLGLKFLECLYFLDIYSIIPNSKDPLKVCILRRLKQLEF